MFKLDSRPVRLALAYKNFAANRAVSHIGLGVTALNTAKTLRHAGIETEVFPITSPRDLRDSARMQGITHMVISAPWIPTMELATICANNPDIQFAVNCHSNLGFLQADPNAVRLLREGLGLHRGSLNFHMAANSHRLSDWATRVYGTPCSHLPNLYFLDGKVPEGRQYKGGTLRIGAFGATRALKNLTTSAGAALEIARALNADLEFWISSGRSEGAGPVIDAVRQMTHGMPHVKLVENGWQTWPEFRNTVRNMHLLLQPSYTESFNVVTADGIAEGVASVVSDAIDWAPDAWKAPVDDAHAMAATGLRLLRDRNASKRGYAALQKHNRQAVSTWREFVC